MSVVPSLQNAGEDVAGMALWAAFDAQKLPSATTLTGAVAGSLVWQYYVKERAAKYTKKITAGEIGTAIAGALAGTPGAFSELETDVEDNVLLYVLGRPLTYLAAMYAVGMVMPSERLSLPSYLTIAAAGSGTGSFVRANYTNPAAQNATPSE